MRLPPDLDRKYEFLEAVRKGGMGAVYKVRHRDLNRVMVAKTLLLPKNATVREQEELQKRFRNEARLASQLEHPNIAQILDLSQDGDWIVMEYVDGPTVRDLLESGPPPIALSLEIVRQALRALAYLHRQGWVHRDISPENLMVTRDPEGAPLVKTIDLGIARAVAETGHQLTGKGGFIGKPLYASPEHFNDLEPIDGRSDLYSIGVVLYELLTGVHPFLGRSPRPGQSQRPADFNISDPEGRIPPELRKILLMALEENPEMRFQSAQEFAARLTPIQARFPLDLGHMEDLAGRAPGSASVLPPPPRAETTRPERRGRLEPAPETRWSPRAPDQETRTASLTAAPPLPVTSPVTSPPGIQSPPASRPPAAPPVPRVSSLRPSPPSQKRRWPITALLILVCLLLGGYWLWTHWPLGPLRLADRDSPRILERPADNSVSNSDSRPEPAVESRAAGDREEPVGARPPEQESPAEPVPFSPDQPAVPEPSEPPPGRTTPAETPRQEPGASREPEAAPEPRMNPVTKVPSSLTKEPEASGRSSVRPQDEPTAQKQERRQSAPDDAPPIRSGTSPPRSDDAGKSAPKPRQPREERPPAKKGGTVEGGAEFFDSESALLLVSPRVVYPEAAQGTGTYAKITVGFWIDETGAVADPRIERSQVQGTASAALFEAAALSAARKAKFQPAMERGVPVRSWSSLDFTFEAN